MAYWAIDLNTVCLSISSGSSFIAINFPLFHIHWRDPTHWTHNLSHRKKYKLINSPVLTGLKYCIYVNITVFFLYFNYSFLISHARVTSFLPIYHLYHNHHHHHSRDREWLLGRCPTEYMPSSLHMSLLCDNVRVFTNDLPDDLFTACAFA